MGSRRVPRGSQLGLQRKCQPRGQRKESEPQEEDAALKTHVAPQKPAPFTGLHGLLDPLLLLPWLPFLGHSSEQSCL